MMKQLCTIILALFIMSVNAQYTMDRYHTQELIVENNIESYTICKVSIELDKIDTIPFEKLSFNKQGLIIRVDRLWENGSHYTYYDSLDRVLLEIDDFPNIDHYEIDSFIYEDDRLVKIIEMGANRIPRWVNEYSYEGDSVKHSVITTIKNNTSRERTSYYDSNQRLSVFEFNGSGEKHLFNYDEIGNLIEFKSLNTNGNLNLLHTFRYNGNLRVEHVIYKGDAFLSGYYMEYDDNGLIRKLYMYESQSAFEQHDLEITPTKVYRYTYRE
ncbi:MAG: hypothetical protein QNK23_06605 [Crocinitomicaceae bacterium]|nr:hypothetical protein [Crocinitomicaceae bacterium]